MDSKFYYISKPNACSRPAVSTRDTVLVGLFDYVRRDFNSRLVVPFSPARVCCLWYLYRLWQCSRYFWPVPFQQRTPMSVSHRLSSLQRCGYQW